jgi:RNA polymerase sigma-70 factor (ECF subfamily)
VPNYYARSPEALLVGMARRGNRDAFEELVNRRQLWIRNLMRRCSGDVTLADDLAQQVFLQAWRSIPGLQKTSRFGAWLKRLAVNTWLQHLRRNDPLRYADEPDDTKHAGEDATGVAMDLDAALAQLPVDVRTCIVLSYHEGMTHGEIADLTGIRLGTVKSHIRRGTNRLREQLSAYGNESIEEKS